ncbi:MAG TPA: hypothetical protein VGI22_28130, partial [Xanthobacteraceae bacterium]
MPLPASWCALLGKNWGRRSQRFNNHLHPTFSAALRGFSNPGRQLLAVECLDSMTIKFKGIDLDDDLAPPRS